ncbi:MAG: hypothetical protein ACOC93_06320 [Planctomycetota bacterium]
MTDTEQYDRVCKGEFDQLHRKLDRLDEAIRGNGKPGILIRLDRLEQSARRQARLVWLIIGAFVTSGVSLLIAWIAS